MNYNEKYTKDRLEELVRVSFCYSDVVRKLGKKVGGGVNGYIKRKIQLFNIDTSHFTGRAANQKREFKRKRHFSDILKLRDSGYRQEAVRLRTALIESGVPYKCSICGISEWLNKKISLQIDHLNRQWWDDRKENLRFLCPNCHSQTIGWCGRREPQLCEGCKKEKTRNEYALCGSCAQKKRDSGYKYKVSRPPIGQLISEIEIFGYCAVGRKYGVSDNAIRKWIRREHNKIS